MAYHPRGRPPPGSSPVYQIDFNAVASGKRIASSKRRVRWRFGFTNLDALQAGETGTNCRGEEHDVTLVWSVSSGKRLVLADGEEVHYSVNRGNIMDFSWAMRGDHVLRVIASASPPLNPPPGYRQYDFYVDGASFFSMPKVYRLGLAHGAAPAAYRNYSVAANQDTTDPANPLTQIEAPRNVDEEKAYLQAAIENSLKQEVPEQKPAEGPGAGEPQQQHQDSQPEPPKQEENLLLDFFSEPAPAPLPALPAPAPSYQAPPAAPQYQTPSVAQQQYQTQAPPPGAGPQYQTQAPDTMYQTSALVPAPAVQTAPAQPPFQAPLPPAAPPSANPFGAPSSAPPLVQRSVSEITEMSYPVAAATNPAATNPAAASVGFTPAPTPASDVSAFGAAPTQTPGADMFSGFAQPPANSDQLLSGAAPPAAMPTPAVPTPAVPTPAQPPVSAQTFPPAGAPSFAAHTSADKAFHDIAQNFSLGSDSAPASASGNPFDLAPPVPAPSLDGMKAMNLPKQKTEVMNAPPPGALVVSGAQSGNWGGGLGAGSSPYGAPPNAAYGQSQQQPFNSQYGAYGGAPAPAPGYGAYPAQPPQQQQPAYQYQQPPQQPQPNQYYGGTFGAASYGQQ